MTPGVIYHHRGVSRMVEAVGAPRTLGFRWHEHTEPGKRWVRWCDVATGHVGYDLEANMSKWKPAS